MQPSRRLWLCVPLALALVVCLGVPAQAADEEPGTQDLREQIRKQMEKIRKLMQENETALLDLSAGGKSKTRRVDVDVPPPPKGSGSGADEDGGTAGGSSEQGGTTSGTGVRKAIDELLRKQEESGQPIPEEITRLVKMIPL